MTDFYHSFDNMCWVRAGERISDLDWKLRYHPDSITRTEQLLIASALSCYVALVHKTQKRRNYICKKLQEVEHE